MLKYEIVFKKVKRIVKENYYYDTHEFKEELYKSLKTKTGSDNIAALCLYAIDIILKFDCDKIVTNAKNNTSINSDFINQQPTI